MVQVVAKKLSVIDVDLCVGCQCCMFACTRRFAEAGISKSAIHVQSAGGFERGFVVTVCRACQDPPCMKVCPTDALMFRKGGGVTLTSAKCIGCQNCVEECTINAIFWDNEVNKPIICVHCGYCTDFCPYYVLGLKSIGSEKP
ncbi:MAG: 4Fe-4S binding protein [Candidatus Bathyarchaeota archaeon]